MKYNESIPRQDADEKGAAEKPESPPTEVADTTYSDGTPPAKKSLEFCVAFAAVNIVVFLFSLDAITLSVPPQVAVPVSPPSLTSPVSNSTGT